MPLEKGSSEMSLHENIKRLVGEGKPRKQALAIAYDIQQKAKQKADSEIYSCNPLSNEPKGPFDQHGAANPLGFVYGGIQNQFPLG